MLLHLLCSGVFWGVVGLAGFLACFALPGLADAQSPPPSLCPDGPTDTEIAAATGSEQEALRLRRAVVAGCLATEAEGAGTRSKLDELVTAITDESDRRHVDDQAQLDAMTADGGLPVLATLADGSRVEVTNAPDVGDTEPIVQSIEDASLQASWDTWGIAGLLFGCVVVAGFWALLRP